MDFFNDYTLSPLVPDGALGVCGVLEDRQIVLFVRPFTVLFCVRMVPFSEDIGAEGIPPYVCRSLILSANGLGSKCRLSAHMAAYDVGM
jgi:hypothetical protein